MSENINVMELVLDATATLNAQIAELQSTITEQADLIRRLREMCGWMLKYGEVTWKPMSDSEPRFMESLRTLMNELEKREHVQD